MESIDEAQSSRYAKSAAQSMGSAPPERSRARRFRIHSAARSSRSKIKLAVLVALVILTAWTVTRSNALTEAEDAYKRGNYVQAAKHAADYLNRRPWSRTALLLAARSLTELDFADDAEAYYRRAGTLDRDASHARAYGLVRANQRKNAEDAYKQILARWPDDALALRRLSAELMTQSRWDDALGYAERLTRTPDGKVDGYAMIGAIHHGNRNHEAAIAAYEKVLEIDPDLEDRSKIHDFRHAYWSRNFWMQLSQDLLTIGRAPEARAYLQKALARGEDPLLLKLLGTADYVVGDFEGARRSWNRAVEIEPNLGEAWLDLGRLAQAENRPADAVPVLLQAYKLMPNSHEPAYRLARVYRLLGQADQADRYQRRSEELRKLYPPQSGGMGPMPSPAGEQDDVKPTPAR
jgi:tetratricopeptide (TPR) repeat protein